LLTPEHPLASSRGWWRPGRRQRRVRDESGQNHQQHPGHLQSQTPVRVPDPDQHQASVPPSNAQGWATGRPAMSSSPPRHEDAIQPERSQTVICCAAGAVAGQSTVASSQSGFCSAWSAISVQITSSGVCGFQPHTS
jgi:hypothetical protein